MKKIYLVLFTVILNLGLFSCTPESVADDEIQVEACCGDGGDIPPPPPGGGKS